VAVLSTLVFFVGGLIVLRGVRMAR